MARINGRARAPDLSTIPLWTGQVIHASTVALFATIYALTVASLRINGRASI
jgi:hypothetical protein